MPPIRSVQIAADTFQIRDQTGVVAFDASAIPAAVKNLAAIEDWINTTWLPAHVNGYQVQVHVFSLNPLALTVMTANLGVAIPASWWID